MAQNLIPIEFICGEGGLNRLQNLTNFPETDLSWVESLTVENITWQKMAGAAKYNSSATPVGIYNIWDFFSAAFVQEMVGYLSDGRLVTIATDGTLTKTLRALTATNTQGWFAEGWLDTATKAVFFFNGTDVPNVYTGGATSADITAGSPDWTGANQPTAGFLHRFRLIAVGGTNKHRAYLSSPRNHGDFSTEIGDSAQLNIYPGEGQRLVGGVSFRAKAYLFKYPRGIYFIDDSDPNIQNWQTPRVTNAIGVAGPGCVCAGENDVVILDTEGYFHGMSQVQTFDQEMIPPMFSREVSDFIRTNINLNALETTRSYFYGRKRLMIFALPGLGSSIPNRYLMIDYNSVAPRLLWSSRDEAIGLTGRRNNKIEEPIICDSSGFIWRLDQSARNKGGAGYRSQYEYAEKPLIENGIRRMNLYELEVQFQPQGNYNLNVEVHKLTNDGVAVETLTFSQQTAGIPVGSVSFDPDTLAGETIQTGRRRLHGDANYLKIIGYNDNADETFSVINHIVRGKPGRYA